MPSLGFQLNGRSWSRLFSAGNNSTVSQLGRIQRDLRGLPPVVSVEPQSSNKESSLSMMTQRTGAHQNKKIKFDDDGESTTVNEGTKTTDIDGDEEPKQEETQDTLMQKMTDDQEENQDDDDDDKENTKRER